VGLRGRRRRARLLAGLVSRVSGFDGDYLRVHLILLRLLQISKEGEVAVPAG
jgi:hypothetical protein